MICAGKGPPIDKTDGVKFGVGDRNFKLYIHQIYKTKKVVDKFGNIR